MAKETKKGLLLPGRKVREIRECAEILEAVETLEYHNKNWLPLWAIQNPGILAREKLDLLDRLLVQIGRSGASRHT